MLDWLRLVTATFAQLYLVMTLTLAIIALLPTAFGWQATVVQTGSMGPLIDPGDVVITSPWEPDRPVPLGSVVAFRSPAEAEPSGREQLRLHRIVGDRGDGTFTTAGDANSAPDSTPLHPDQIAGQGRLYVPFIGLPSLWVRTEQAGVLLIWAVATALSLAVVHREQREDSDADGIDDGHEIRESQAGLHP